MNAERARKPRPDGLLSLLSLENHPPELPHIQSLHDFCETRRLSLRSRLELVEHVASLVAAAHESGSGFLRISSRTVNVEYVDGGLSMDIPAAIPAPRPREDPNRTVTTGRFDSGQLIRAANVVELGQMLVDLTGRISRLDPRLSDVVSRATDLQSARRIPSVAALRDEITLLRRACEASSTSTPALAVADGADRSFAQRWSWAD